MKIFFDTEFTGLVPNTTLISIGMVSEDGRKFYAEFTDYDKKLCDAWVIKNVIANLILTDPDYDNPNIWENSLDKAGIKYLDGYDDFVVKGSSSYVREILIRWLKVFFDEPIQMVSDVCHYDMTLFCNLFGGAFNLPQNVSPFCYDINCDLMQYFADDMAGDYYICDEMNISKAFDMSRENFVTKVLKEELPSGAKHNSLYDAMVIKQIYEGIRERQ